MKITKLLALSLTLVLSCQALLGCSTEKKATAEIPANPSTDIQATDYSQGEHWLAVPAALDKDVDVFYLYPTAWAKANASDPIICNIDNPLMLKNSKLAYERQATAFETVGNIYAPYYRQEDAASTLAMPLDQQKEMLDGIPKADAFAAFDYYIKNYNNGRPFILASHSQGSNIMILLLSEYMKEHPDVYDRMIAAYVIGYSVTDEYLAANPHLKFAKGPEDTGVIISYNTQAPTIEGTDPVVLPGARVINPISWTTDETLAPASESLGSIAVNPDGSIVSNPDGTYKAMLNYADAQVDIAKGALICSTADVAALAPGNPTFGKGVFHSFNFPFYYYDLRGNAALRTEKFLLQSK